MLDGAPLGVEDLTAPYTTGWNTTLGGNGSHVLTAIARDAAGRETTSAPVTVTVANSGSDPAQVGQWSAPTTLPIVPIHTSMLPNGKLLIFDSATNSGTNPRVWDPVARDVHRGSVQRHREPVLRRAHAPRGRPDPRRRGSRGRVRRSQERHDLRSRDEHVERRTSRWRTRAGIRPSPGFPTVGCSSCPARATAPTADSGCAAHRHRRRTGDLRSCDQQLVDGYGRRAPASLDPNLYVLPDGRIFAASTAEEAIASRVLDLTTKTWSVVDSSIRDGGSSVMYQPGKILKTGKAWNPDYPVANATSEAWVIDMN